MVAGGVPQRGFGSRVRTGDRGGRLVVWRGDPDGEGARFDRAYELTERACERLERAGWTIVFQEK
jgi:hypothetical protein